MHQNSERGWHPGGYDGRKGEKAGGMTARLDGPIEPRS